MRRILYASDRKINTFLSRRSGRSSGRGLSFGGGIAGISLNASLSPATTNDSADTDGLSLRLRSIQKHLMTEQDLPDFQQTELRQGEWITFDTPMTYGTAHKDSGRIPDDVIFFATQEQPRLEPRVTSLLLCGSIEHMRDRVASAGRMGSGTDWLHELTRAIYEHELNTNDRPIGTLSAVCRRPWPAEVSEGQVARWVHDVMNMDSPTNQCGRLRGYAEVLMDCDNPGEFIDRLVLATPLYVELVPVAPRTSRWKRWKRRLLATVGMRNPEFSASRTPESL